MKRDPRVDAYIADAPAFAKPILERIRERVHSLVPNVEEAMKWRRPTFLKDGKILLGTAAFKEHASVDFWRRAELGRGNDDPVPELGRLTSVDDLPANIDTLIRNAAEISPMPKVRGPRDADRPKIDMHPQFASALEQAPAARARFESFAPSHQREYLEWVAEAKQDATRHRRIATAVEWISQGKRRNWKYEGC